MNIATHYDFLGARVFYNIAVSVHYLYLYYCMQRYTK